MRDDHHGTGLPAPVPGDTAHTAPVPQLGRGDQESLAPVLIDNDLMPVVLGDGLPSLVPDHPGAGPPGHHTANTDLANSQGQVREEWWPDQVIILPGQEIFLSSEEFVTESDMVPLTDCLKVMMTEMITVI